MFTDPEVIKRILSAEPEPNIYFVEGDDRIMLVYDGGNLVVTNEDGDLVLSRPITDVEKLVFNSDLSAFHVFWKQEKPNELD